MKIINKNIDSLVFAEYNPRQLTAEQYQQLKDSIERFGLVDPIIVNQHKDRKNVIIGGHQRTRVAKKLGIEEVPCVFVNLSYEKERELNVRLNKNVGGWDYDILADNFELEELTDWGFSEKNLFGMFGEVDYSILEDDDVDMNMEALKDGTRKAIQIEFKLEDYDEATELLKLMREKHEYVGKVVVDFFKKDLNEK